VSERPEATDASRPVSAEPRSGLPLTPARRRRYRLAPSPGGGSPAGPVIDFPVPGGPDGHVDDQAAAYALGALEPDEVAAVERHIAACPRCARAVEAARRTAALLPFLAPPATPAPDVKAALFARIAQSQAQAVPAAAATPVWAAPPSPVRTPTLPASGPWLVAVPASPSPPAPAPARRGRPGRLSAVSTVATLALVVGLLGAWSLGLNEGDDTPSYEEALGSILGGENAQALDIDTEVAGTVDVRSLYFGVRPGNEAAAVITFAESPAPDTTYWVYPVGHDGSVDVGAPVKINTAGRGSAILQLSWPADRYARGCVAKAGEDPRRVCTLPATVGAP